MTLAWTDSFASVAPTPAAAGVEGGFRTMSRDRWAQIRATASHRRPSPGWGRRCEAAIDPIELQGGHQSRR